jgi:hypothetical protein
MNDKCVVRSDLFDERTERRFANTRELFPLHNNLRTFAFASAENDGLMCGGLIRRGAAAMSVATEVKLAFAKFAPQQSGGGRGHNHQGNHWLPVRIHGFNISGGAPLAMCFSNDSLPD